MVSIEELELILKDNYPELELNYSVHCNFRSAYQVGKYIFAVYNTFYHVTDNEDQLNGRCKYPKGVLFSTSEVLSKIDENNLKPIVYNLNLFKELNGIK